MPAPGSSVFHRTLDVSLHVTGGVAPAATPFPSGPRHCGQSAALVDRGNSRANKVANPILEWKFIGSFMFFSQRLILRDAVEEFLPA